jgi:hypothetical protein
VTIEYLRGYRMVRRDPHAAKKLLVGALLLFSGVAIPFVGQVVLQGWQGIIVRRMVRGHEGALPRLDFDFEYLGKLLMEGFKPLVVSILWSLPAVFIAVPFLAGGYLGMLYGFVAVSEGDGSSGLVVVGVSFAVLFAGGLSMMLLLIPSRVAALRAELSGDLNEGLKFGEVMRFTRENFGVLLKGTLVLALVGAVLGIAGLMLCYVGAFAAGYAGIVAQGVFVAQVYQAHVARGGDPIPIKDLPIDDLGHA